MTSIIDSRTDGPDRRTHPRCRDQGLIYVGDGSIARRCAFIDISEGGARIAIGRGVEFPTDVVLVDPETGFSRRATVVWRSQTDIGVRYGGEGVRYRVMRRAGDVASGWGRPSRRLAA